MQQAAGCTPSGCQSARPDQKRPQIGVLKGGRARLSALQFLYLRIFSGTLPGNQISYQLSAISFPISFLSAISKFPISYQLVDSEVTVASFWFIRSFMAGS
ncbi:MAG: hypothetical protein FJ308_18450 [Planctomycetes bacterium]|nr:hypothetical protein [Planctomycetota bacterium]